MGAFHRRTDWQAATSPSDVSVVVCAYTEERWPDILAAVRSVLDQETAPREVILVVDHNRRLFDRASGEIPSATVVENAGPRGLSGARNTGIAAAGGELIAFLDDDARAEPGWLAALVAPYADPRVIGTGGHAEPAWDAGRPRWFPDEFGWVVGCSYRGQPGTVATVRNPLGCNMSFRRSVFADVGGFRPEVGRVGRTPIGCEETELSVRAQANRPGAVIVYVPAAVVRHRVPAARSRFGYFRARCFSEGRSKAVVTAFAGRGPGLATERGYALRVLPGGVAHGVADLARGDPAGPGRSAAIVLGLAFTTAGYLTERAALAVGRRRLVVRPAEPIPLPPTR